MRLCGSDGSILTKSFGTGIAYPTVTNDGMMRADRDKVNHRADSFSLYCNWVANRILLNLLPKTQLDNKLQKTLRKNRKKAIENQPNNNNNVVNKEKSAEKKSKSNNGSPNKPVQTKNPSSNNVYKNIESVVKNQMI